MSTSADKFNADDQEPFRDPAPKNRAPAAPVGGAPKEAPHDGRASGAPPSPPLSRPERVKDIPRVVLVPIESTRVVLSAREGINSALANAQRHVQVEIVH